MLLILNPLLVHFATLTALQHHAHPPALHHLRFTRKLLMKT